jgi:hypothetical protein
MAANRSATVPTKAKITRRDDRFARSGRVGSGAAGAFGGGDEANPTVGAIGGRAEAGRGDGVAIGAGAPDEATATVLRRSCPGMPAIRDSDAAASAVP